MQAHSMVFDRVPRWAGGRRLYRRSRRYPKLRHQPTPFAPPGLEPVPFQPSAIYRAGWHFVLALACGIAGPACGVLFFFMIHGI
jgi:hypothetical protein